MKPLSGSGARALMIDVMQTHGVDSLAGRMAAVMQGSTETTFYVLAGLQHPQEAPTLQDVWDPDIQLS